MCKKFVMWSVIVLLTLPSFVTGAETKAELLLEKYCYSCHDQDTDKGDIRLDNLRSLKNNDMKNLLEKVREQVYFKNMPPEKKKKQPTSEERKALFDWASGYLEKVGGSDFNEIISKPHFANYVDHKKLFSGEVKDEAYSPARLWRRSSYDFDNAKIHFLGRQKNLNERQIQSRQNSVDGKNTKQPFPMPDGEGIQNYAALLYADSATFDTLYRNAEYIVDKTLLMAFIEMDYKSLGKTMEDWKADRQKVLDEQQAQIKQYEKEGKTTRYIRGMHSEINAKYKYQTPEVYRKIVLSEGKPSKDLMEEAIRLHFDNTIQRLPSDAELSKYVNFMGKSIDELGPYFGLRSVLMTILLSPEFIYRSELGLGKKLSDGRQMLSSVELAFAISYALTDRMPDDKLLKALQNGKLSTREDVRREVTRILEDDSIEKPKILRFFQQFFGYTNAPHVFKDLKRFTDKRLRNFEGLAKYYVEETDNLIMYIIEQDKDVFKELLTTDKYIVAHSGDNDEMKAKQEADRKIYEYFKKLDYKKFKGHGIPKEHQKFSQSVPGHKHLNIPSLKVLMKHKEAGQKAGINTYGERGRIEQLEYLTAYNIDGKTWDYPENQPFKIANRAGILTHPSWLIAHSLNSTTDPVRRGKWIRERLLAGTIPEVPITVDATIPEDHNKTLRERYSITQQQECWRCHTKMNPLGYAFEAFDDFGRYRTDEVMEGLPKVNKKYQTKPVNAKGFLEGSGDSSLDGEVKDALDLIHRLGKSRKVQQSFIRHSFRYWMGRNEMLTDSKVLIRAEKDYMENGGSFKALLISLLTSDSFIYRKHLD